MDEEECPKTCASTTVPINGREAQRDKGKMNVPKALLKEGYGYGSDRFHF
jgi:hypothetical protein